MPVYHATWSNPGSATYFCCRTGTLTLLLTEDDVRALLPVSRAMDLVEEGLRLVAQGSAVNRSRDRIPYPGGLFHYMAAAAPTADAVGLKCYASGAGGAAFAVLLFSTETSELLAVLEADALGRIRTGAASGVATRLLARPDARTATVIGAGSQADTQIEALAAARRLETIRVYSRRRERSEDLVRRLQPRVPVALEPADSLETAVRDSDIVTTITTASQPVFDGSWLRNGCHVNAAGSNQARRREIDTATVSRAAVIAVDSVEQARKESGDLIAAADEGDLTWDRVVELGDLLAGKVERAEPGAVTLFESQGLAIEDVVVARHVYDAACREGRGRSLDISGRAG